MPEVVYPHVRLLKVKLQRRGQIAVATIEVNTQGRLKQLHVQDGDCLQRKTGSQEYAGFAVGEVRAHPNQGSMEIVTPDTWKWLEEGERLGGPAQPPLPTG